MPLRSTGNPFGIPFIELQSVDSTNKYAMTLVYDGKAVPGMAIFAHEQTAGKGQRGKKWSSSRDVNISLSLVANPFPLRLSDAFQLSACVALAAADLCVEYTADDIKIKWPNDIYWRDRKAGGILIENVIKSGKSGKWEWSVIGIGINVNQTAFSSDLPNPVSLRQITGKTLNTVELAKELCKKMDARFTELLTNGFEKIHADYLEFLYKKDQRVRLKKGSRVFETTIKGVTKNGQLITEHGIEERFDFGEIEWQL